jgi:hypothetical protein
MVSAEFSFVLPPIFLRTSSRKLQVPESYQMDADEKGQQAPRPIKGSER